MNRCDFQKEGLISLVKTGNAFLCVRWSDFQLVNHIEQGGYDQSSTHRGWTDAAVKE